MNVQVENGHVKIATELLEFLCSFRIPGAERQVFDAIMRKTWGWRKKADRISNSQLIVLTGMSKANVSRALRLLIEHQLVNSQDNNLSINKNCNDWKPFIYGLRYNPVNGQDNKVVNTQDNTVNSQDNNLLTAKMDTIATTKATLQKQGKNPALSADSFFSPFMDSANEVVSGKATEFDVRPKDIAYCARMAMEWYRGNETESHNDIWWDSKFNQWITRSIRHHELLTNTDREAQEAAEAAKPKKLVGEDKFIAEMMRSGRIK